MRGSILIKTGFQVLRFRGGRVVQRLHVDDEPYRIGLFLRGGKNTGRLRPWNCEIAGKTETIEIEEKAACERITDRFFR